MTITPPTPPAPPTPPPADPPTPPPAGDAKTFTQAELDAIVKDRLARAKSQFADYDDLKGKAAKFDEIDAASKSELEKAQAKIAEAEKKAADALDRAKTASLKSAVLDAAHKANAVDGDAVFALLDKSKVTVSDDGAVTGIDDALKALLAEKPYLVGKATTPQGGSADGGARGVPVQGQLTEADIKRLFREGKHEEIDKARREGRLTQAMGA